MKKAILSIAVAGSLVISATSAIAGGVGFVNIQDVFNSVPLGKEKANSDQKKLKPKIEKLKQEVTTLQAKVNQSTDKDSNSKDTKSSNKQETSDKTETQKKLQNAIQEYQSLMSQIQKTASDDAAAFKTALAKASEEVAKQKNLDAILPSEISLYNVDSADVTKDITAKMQSEPTKA